MFKISKLSDYSTVIVHALAALAPEQLLSAHEIAQQTHIPLPTVSKVLKLLAERNLVTSERGANGGYRLARPAANMNLMEVISAIEGTPALTECSQHHSTCQQQDSCAVKQNWRFIHHLVMQLLSRISVAEMGTPLVQQAWLSKFLQESHYAK